MSAAPPPVRGEVLRILDAVLRGRTTSSLALDRLRCGDARQHALATELVLGCLRRLLSLDRELARLSRRPLERLDPQVLLALRIGLYQLRYMDAVPAATAVDQSVELVRLLGRTRAVGFVNAVLRAAARGNPPPPDLTHGTARALSQQHSLPEWLLTGWVERWGEEAAQRVCEAQNQPPLTGLRVNSERVDREQLRQRLAAEGFACEPLAALPEGLQCQAGRVAHSAALAAGLGWVQDPAAMLAVRAVGARRGEAVYDACAAPGGKAQGLALEVGPGGTVVAGEARVERLRMLRDNLRRLGLERVLVLATDAAAPGLRAGFDRILLDAPCSGSGTLRRNPELRWRLSPQRVAELAASQLALLRGVAPLLRPGGRLVYATCSVEPEENEALVERFLAQQPGYQRLDLTPSLPAELGSMLAPDGVLRSWPERPEWDGFVVQALVRGAA